MDEAPPKPTLMGVMSQEAIPFVTVALSPEQIKNYSVKEVEHHIEVSICSRSQAKDEADPIKKELLDFYTAGITHPLVLIQKNVELSSDVLFIQSIFKEMEVKAKKNWEIYFYIWDYMNANISKIIPVKGAMHSCELYILFDQKCRLPFESTEDDKKIAAKFSEMLSNFCKHGNPSTNSIQFPKYDLEEKKSLWFNIESEVREDPLKERRLFWTELVKKHDFNPLRGITKEKIANRFSW